jgi:flavin reductase (DIM6/NTAB) family NADH-FMN oxidoreductase RutF
MAQDALAFLDCRLMAKFTPGDHNIFVGEVLEGVIVEEGNPMASNDLKSTYGGIGYS